VNTHFGYSTIVLYPKCVLQRSPQPHGRFLYDLRLIFRVVQDPLPRSTHAIYKVVLEKVALRSKYNRLAAKRKREHCQPLPVLWLKDGKVLYPSIMDSTVRACEIEGSVEEDDMSMSINWLYLELG